MNIELVITLTILYVTCGVGTISLHHKWENATNSQLLPKFFAIIWPIVLIMVALLPHEEK